MAGEAGGPQRPPSDASRTAVLVGGAQHVEVGTDRLRLELGKLAAAACQRREGT